MARPYGIADQSGMILRFRRSVFCAVIAFWTGVSVACGGGGDGDTTTRERNPTGPSRPSPTPSVPTATVQLQGDGQLTGCVQVNARLRCEFGETGKNNGPGCASAVRGNIRLMSGETEIASEAWSLPETRVLMPDEQFNYTVNIGALADAIKSVNGYLTRLQWTNTPC
jgi:hypothetical protein